MEVRFTKLTGRAYEIAVRRDRGPALAPRRGPGYDDDLPHDAVHLVVEAESGLRHGVYGRVAAGRNTIFWPVDPDERRREKRREARKRPTADEDADMARSEELAALAVRAWRHGEPVDDPVLARIVARLAEVADRWRALPEGGGITLEWPGLSPGRARSAAACASPAGARRSPTRTRRPSPGSRPGPRSGS